MKVYTKIPILWLLAAAAMPLLVAQGDVIPLLDCIDYPPNPGGYSMLAHAASAGDGSITVTQNVPPLSALTLNPGGATQETVSIGSITASGTTYVVNFSPALTHAHSSGERVAFIHYTAVSQFGAFNTVTASVNVAAGSPNNFFLPGAPNNGQPSTFAPGYVRRLFGVPFSSANDLIWILENGSAVARYGVRGFTCPATPTEVASAFFKIAKGQTRTSVTLGTIALPNPSGGTLAVANLSVFNECQAQDYGNNCRRYMSFYGGGLSVTNLQIVNGVITGDVSAPPDADGRFYVITYAIKDSSGNTLTTGAAFADVTDSCGLTPSIGPNSPLYVGTPLTTAASVTGGNSPYTFNVDSGVLPPGITLLPSGSLTGTPTQAGSFSSMVMTTAGDGCFALTPLNLTVQGQSCAADVTAYVNLSLGGLHQNLATRQWTQTVTLYNSSSAAISGPIALVFDHLSSNASLVNAAGFTQCAAPLGSQYLLADLGGQSNTLAPGASASITVTFTNSNPAQAITYTPRVLSGGTQR